MRIAVLISCEVWCWLIPFSSLNGAWFLQLIFDCASCGAWAPEAWKPRFQIFANLWKFNNRWNLKTWFLKIVYPRVSLSKIWAIHQNGRWRTILDPDRQPFLKVELMLLLATLNRLKSFGWYFLVFAMNWIYWNLELLQHVNMKHNNKLYWFIKSFQSFDCLLASLCIIFQPNHFPQLVNTITK